MSLRSKTHQQSRTPQQPKSEKESQMSRRTADSSSQSCGNYLVYLIHENAKDQCIWWDECQNRCTIHAGNRHKNSETCGTWSDAIHLAINAHLLVDFVMDANCFVQSGTDFRCSFASFDACLNGSHGQIEMRANRINVNAIAHKKCCAENFTR